jgi:riboflavin-specific deaminase-like protein
VELLWRSQSGEPGTPVSEDDLLTLYQYPDDLTGPYVRVNLVCTVDGKVAVEGRSRPISGGTDRILFGRLRRLSDVIVMGAGTARADNARGARARDDVREFRRGLGLAEVPPVAVVSGSASVSTNSRLFTDTFVPPIIFTTTSAPSSRVRALTDAGGDVVFAGDERVRIDLMLKELADRGLNRVLCEGGATLFGNLVEANAVDDLCVTVSPLLGGAGRVSTASTAMAIGMNLRSVIVSGGTLLLRYVR